MDSVVNLSMRFEHSVAPEYRTCTRASRATVFLDEREIVEDAQNALRQAFRVPGTAGKPGVADDLPQAANRRRDHEPAAHHLLDRGQASSFLPNRGHDDSVYPAQVFAQGLT